MTAMLGYARVSTGDQDAAGLPMRQTAQTAGASLFSRDLLRAEGRRR
jgi:hypothetical protein